MSEEQDSEEGKSYDEHARPEHPIDVRFDELLDRLDPYWPDLLHQGSIQRKFNRSPTPTYIFQFRQYHSGSRDGRTKRVYIGKSKVLANAVMNEVRRRREEAGNRHRPRKGRRPGDTDHPSLAEFLEKLRRENPFVVFTPGYAGMEGLLEFENHLLSRETREPGREGQ